MCVCVPLGKRLWVLQGPVIESESFYVVDMTGRRTLDGVYIHCIRAGFS